MLSSFITTVMQIRISINIKLLFVLKRETTMRHLLSSFLQNLAQKHGIQIRLLNTIKDDTIISYLVNTHVNLI